MPKSQPTAATCKEDVDTKAYSAEDKRLLRDIIQYVESDVSIPSSYAESGLGSFHARKTGTMLQRRSRQMIFGKVKWRGNTRNSNASKRYPKFMRLCRRFMRSHRPGFRFTGVYLNKNAVCKKHKDGSNSGCSVLVGAGSYTGGKTGVILENGKTRKFDISKRSLKFDGSKLTHWSESFRGDRYSLVFFKS